MKRIPLYLFLSGFLAICTYEMAIDFRFICLSTFILFLFTKNKPYKRMIILCSILFILVFLRMNAINRTTTSLNTQKDRLHYTGRVVSFPIYKEDTVKFILEVGQGSKKEKVQGFIYENSPQLYFGDIIEFNGDANIPKGKRNPGGFDYSKVLKGKDIHALVVIYSDSLTKVGSSLNPIEKLASNFRSQFMDYINNNFTLEEKDFLDGLILGGKSIDDSTVEDFNSIGVSHILSVSGLHVGYIYLFVKKICEFLKVSKKLELIIVSSLLYLYSSMVGFGDPVIRSSLMFVLMLFANLVDKKYDTINVLFLLAGLSILYNPYIIYNVGFQLSYSAVLSIAIIYPYLNKKWKLKTKLLNSIKSLTILSLSVQIGTIPIILYHYYNLSIISLLANLLIVPISGYIIIGFLCTFLLNIILHISSPLLIAPIKLGIKLILDLSDHLVDLPFASIRLAPLSLPLTVFYYMFLFASLGYFYLYQEKNKKILISAALVNLGLLFLIFIFPKKLIVTYLDVGQGDSALIEYPNGYTVLIDGGGVIDYSVGDEIVAKALLSKNIRSLDLVICTHSHDDHKLGIMEIMDDISIKALVINCLEKDGYRNLLKMAKEYRVPVYLSSSSKVRTQDGVSLDFLYPLQETNYIDENNSSIVVKLNYKEVSFLFTGDLCKAGEEVLLARNAKLQSDFLKVGHHGSKTSTGEEFLHEVNPRYGIISVGENNYFSHPNSEVLDLLEKNRIMTLRTDENGAVVISTDGKRVNLQAYVD